MPASEAIASTAAASGARGRGARSASTGAAPERPTAAAASASAASTARGRGARSASAGAAPERPTAAAASESAASTECCSGVGEVTGIGNGVAALIAGFVDQMPASVEARTAAELKASRPAFDALVDAAGARAGA